jgi:adenylate kinase
VNLIFLGPPGAGKGTIAKRVAERHGVLQISTGDLFRDNVKGGTEIGLKAKGYMDRGELVPDRIVIDMLKDRITRDDCRAGFILDGFPRTIPQAEALAADPSVTIDRVVNFVITDEVVVQRLSGRRICPKCGAIFHVTNIPPKQAGVCDACGAALIQREDDREQAIRNRLVVYKQQTEPLIGFYTQRGMLTDINADQPSIDDIVASVSAVMDAA